MEYYVVIKMMQKSIYGKRKWWVYYHMKNAGYKIGIPIAHQQEQKHFVYVSIWMLEF